MELMSQYDATIHYLPREENCAADALSCLPDPTLTVVTSMLATTRRKSICTCFDLEDAILDEIKSGYTNDPFTQKLAKASTGMTNVWSENGFWFINDRLVVPNSNNIRETLFRLAHDNLGHFGSPKT